VMGDTMLPWFSAVLLALFVLPWLPRDREEDEEDGGRAPMALKAKK
jgi:hypothetical protein